MSSNVGSSGVYEAGDQRNYKKSEEPTPDRFNEGKPNAHNKLDSKDERSIANRLAAEEQKDEDDGKSLQAKQIEKDATLPARSHGNEPSRGAKIDQQLKEEEEAYLAKKDAKK